MKITGQQPPRLNDLSAGKAREAEAQPKNRRAAAKRTTPAEGGRPSLTMSRIREAIRSTPDIRTDRVEAARARIERGEYKVDAERLAQKLLSESVRDDIEKP